MTFAAQNSLRSLREGGHGRGCSLIHALSFLSSCITRFSRSSFFPLVGSPPCGHLRIFSPLPLSRGVFCTYCYSIYLRASYGARSSPPPPPPSTSYTLSMGFYVDRESLVRFNTARVVVRASVLLNGIAPVPLRLVEEPVLTLTTTTGPCPQLGGAGRWGRGAGTK